MRDKELMEFVKDIKCQYRKIEDILNDGPKLCTNAIKDILSSIDFMKFSNENDFINAGMFAALGYMLIRKENQE